MSGNRLTIQSQLPPVVFVEPRLRIRFRCIRSLCPFNTISELELRVENQEQYSRQTSLRFHNIKVPVDQRWKIIHPVDTDDLVLQVCNTKLGLDISKADIGKSHMIGKVNYLHQLIMVPCTFKSDLSCSKAREFIRFVLMFFFLTL